MKGTVLGLLFFSLAMAISEVSTERRPVKLCGRDFVRAVVFICGGSRWRRQLTDYPEDLLDTSETDIMEPEAHFGEFIQSRSESEKDLQGKQPRSMHKRHENVMQLSVSCCAIGCTESHISSLC
ncbi:hypothetical protein lerEdw1_011766 [Lerista edwardsae]|nr:hypothetical protein lerEdw1_011766 [Lerista edwardsae]